MTTPDDIQTTNDELDITYQAFILGEVTANCSGPRQDGSRSWRLRMRRQGPELVSTKDGPSTRRDAVRLSTRLALDIASSNADAAENRPDQAFVDGLLQGVAEWLKERGGLLLDADEVAAIHELIAEQLPEGLPKGPLVVKVCELAQALSGERLKADKAPTPFAEGAAEHIFAAKVARCMGLDVGQVLARLQGSDPNFAPMVAERLREGLDQRYLASDGDDLSLSSSERSLILGALLEPDCTDADILRHLIPSDMDPEDLLALGRETWSTLAVLENPFERLQAAASMDAVTSEVATQMLREATLRDALVGRVPSDGHDLLEQVAKLRAERDALAKENADLKVRLGAATIPLDTFEVEDAQGTFEASRATAQRDALLDLIQREAGNTMLRRLALWLGDVEPVKDEYVVGKVEALLELYGQPPGEMRDLRIRREMGTLLEEAGQALNLERVVSYSSPTPHGPVVATLDESEGAA